MIDIQGTRLILNLRDAAVHRDAEFDLPLELMTVHSPAHAPFFVSDITEFTPGTRASVISLAEYPAGDRRGV